MVLLIGRAARRICFNQKDYQDLTRHQYGISAVAPRTPFREETNGGGASGVDCFLRLELSESVRVSGKQPTYPSPKQTFCPK